MRCGGISRAQRAIALAPGEGTRSRDRLNGNKDRGAAHRRCGVGPAPPSPALVRARLHAFEDVGAVTRDARSEIVGIRATQLNQGVDNTLIPAFL